MKQHNNLILSELNSLDSDTFTNVYIKLTLSKVDLHNCHSVLLTYLCGNKVNTADATREERIVNLITGYNIPKHNKFFGEFLFYPFYGHVDTTIAFFALNIVCGFWK